MIHPDDTFKVFLDDKEFDDPSPDRPAIVCKRGTAAGWRRYAADLEGVFKLQNIAYIDGLQKLIGDKATSFENVPGDDVTELLSTNALRALAGSLPNLADVSRADRGKSESPSPTAAAESAESVSPDAAETGV